MKRLSLLALLLLTACSAATPTPEAVRVNRQALPSTPGPAGLGDPFYPLLGNAGYDVQHYDIALAVDPAANTLSGTTTLTAVALTDLTQFHLDFSGLTVDSVAVDDRPADFSRYQMELVITPPGMIPAKRTFTVTVGYHGSPAPVGDDGIHMLSGWQSMPGGTFVASEPSGAMSWFPCNNHWSDKAGYTFRISVPDGYQVVANGLPQGTPGSGTQVWAESVPMSSYLATVVIGRYESEELKSASGVPILDFYPVGTPAAVKDDFARTPDMLDYFSELIAPYPFESYGVVLANQPLGFALETQTRSLFGSQGADEEVVAHELAHQWFGDSLTIAGMRDLWLKEGGATYLSYLWLEHSQGKAAFEQKIQQAYDDAVMGQYGLAFQPIGNLRPEDVNELYSSATYLRGAFTLHALRREVGDETFFRILRTFYARHAGKTASTDDFVAVAKEVSGQNLSDFFTLWLDTYWMPPKP
jgi:aminopeptidase N